MLTARASQFSGRGSSGNQKILVGKYNIVFKDQTVRWTINLIDKGIVGKVDAEFL